MNSFNKNKRIISGLKYAAVLFMMPLFFAFYAENIEVLPKTEILGKEYFVYEAKKGESIYNISKKFGWDLQELMRLNPDASTSLQKGSRLYYPTGQVSVLTDVPEPVEIDYSGLESIKHKVKKGETIYSISRQYNVPLDIIYKNNPSAKKGVKAGDLIEIPQNGNSEYYYYTIKSGDQLPDIAKKFNTSPEDILRNNAGLTPVSVKAGETIRISLNSNLGKVKTELVEEEQVTQLSGYKVSKNESWEDISEKTGVGTEVLKEVNKQDTNPQEDTVITIPLLETVEVEKTVSYDQSQEITQEDVVELYDSIKGNSDDRMAEGVRIALILDEPNSKKDTDFTRGLLVGISDFKNSGIKIDLNVLDGRVSTNNLTDELDAFEPNLIISTADKAFPLFLADYGNTNNIQVVNVFDLKNDLYEDNASMVQLLPPSGIFYDRIATKIYLDNRRRKLLTVGEEDDNDGLAAELFKLYDGAGDKITLEEFGSLDPDITEPLLIYSYATKKEEVDDFMKNVDNLSQNYPALDFKIVGRSNWVALTDDFVDQYEKYSAIVPSRVWLDEDSNEWKKFTDSYADLFGGSPVRSIPNFAASGYDVAKFFITAVNSNHGDFNKDVNSQSEKGLQNDISLSRVNNWGGLINGNSYLLFFKPEGGLEKILVR